MKNRSKVYLITLNRCVNKIKLFTCFLYINIFARRMLYQTTDEIMSVYYNSSTVSVTPLSKEKNGNFKIVSFMFYVFFFVGAAASANVTSNCIIEQYIGMILG